MPQSTPMSTPHAYERHPDLRFLSTSIIAVGADGARPYVLLADTILYPEGGGQPADRGTVNGVSVLDVQKGEDGVRHVLASALAPGPAEVALDWGRRFDHMQQHTAQHLLSALAADRFGWATTSFHLQPEVCDIELAAEALSAVDLEALEAAVAAEIRAARPVSARRVSVEEYEATPGVRSRGLPAGHVGDVRLVEISGLDLATCGGTHLSSTAEIEALKLLGTEKLRGGVRLFWLAGERVRRRLAAHEARNAALRSILGGADAEFPDLVATKLARLKDALRRERDLADRLADAMADALLARPEPVVEAHFEDLDATFLARVGRRFAAGAGPRLAFLTATGPKGGAFLLAKTSSCPTDLKALGPEIANLLGGKGGGAGQTFQGQAPSLANRAAALARLASP